MRTRTKHHHVGAAQTMGLFSSSRFLFFLLILFSPGGDSDPFSFLLGGLVFLAAEAAGRPNGAKRRQGRPLSLLLLFYC